MVDRKFNISDIDTELKQSFVPDSSGELEVEPKTDVFDDQMVFEWDALEFEYYEKGKNWRWGLVGVAVLLAVVFGIMQNWMGMILVILSGILIYQYAYKQPRKLHYIVTKEGFVIDEKVYHYDQVISYWMTGEGILYMNTKWWPPRLSVKVVNVNLEELDRFLSHFIKKEERKEKDTGDNFSGWIRF